MMFDLMNRLAVKRAISPVSIADNTAAVSQILDMQGQMAACLVIATGAIADAEPEDDVKKGGERYRRAKEDVRHPAV